MQLSRPLRRRRMINLTPLIDVVFLLLVFFMLASTFLKFGTVKIEMAGGGTATTDSSRIALIHVGPNQTFQVAGAPVTLGRLAAALEKVRADGRTDAVVVLKQGATTADLMTGLTEVKRHPFQSVRVVE